MSSREALEKAIDIAGGQTALGRLIGKGDKGQGSVWWWLNRSDGKVPSDIAIKIERELQGKVKRHELRPDLFDEGTA